jgi:hypothetical protein
MTAFKAGQNVIIETYTPEACIHLGTPPPCLGCPKRSQTDRAIYAKTFLMRAKDKPLSLCGNHAIALSRSH